MNRVQAFAFTMFLKINSPELSSCFGIAEAAVFTINTGFSFFDIFHLDDQIDILLVMNISLTDA